MWNRLNAEDKTDHLRGGKQNQRDGSIKQYPIEFQRWYHRDYKEPGDKDATREELKELYQQWLDENMPDESSDIDSSTAN